MGDVQRIVGFDWDAGNARKNEKHGIAAGEAEQAFFNPRLLVVANSGYSAGETRFHAMGVTIDGRHLHLTFTLRVDGTRIRIISARDMHRKERHIHARKD